MFSRLFAVLWLVMLFGIMQIWTNNVHAEPSKNIKQFGQTKLAEFTIDEETINKMQKLKPSKPEPGQLAIVNALLADSVDWYGETLELSNQKNPYTIVLTMTGETIADGDVVSMWTAGWRDSEGLTKANPVPGLSKLGLKAGEPFSITAAATSNSVTTNSNLTPMVGMSKLENINLTKVTVQVWSGIPEASGVQIFSAMNILLLGIAMGLVMLYFRRR
jgi:hypothetical protein